MAIEACQIWSSGLETAMFPELGLGSKGDFKTIEESPEVCGANLHSYNILQFKSVCS